MTIPAHVAAQPDAPMMIIPSDLLGDLTVAPSDLLLFRDGLLGFPECRDFVLLPAARDGLYWLQSVQHAALAFLLVDPFLFFPGFSVDLGPQDLVELRATQPSDVAVLTIVTLPREPESTCTTNLQGPLALNLQARIAKQIAIADSEYGVRCAVDLR